MSYLTAMDDAGKSKNIGKNLVRSIKCFKFILGGYFEIEVVLGPVIVGCLSRVLATRDPTSQARALTVAEVQSLESLLTTLTNKYDRYFVGRLLFCLYSRSRWSDMSNIQKFYFDVIETEDGPFGFVEAFTRIHKTSNTAEKKAMYMQSVAPR